MDDHVRLLFEHGNRLSDPDGLLEGTDRKQVRWITVRPGTGLPDETVETLVTAALHHGRLGRIGRPASERRRR